MPAASTRAGRSLRLILLLILVAVVATAAIGVGAVGLSPAQVGNVLLHPEQAPPVARTIVWQIRLPRVALALLVGMALALAGAAFQGLLRNPLADPGILGVSAGSSLGAAAVIYLSYQMGAVSAGLIPVGAFVTGLVTVLAVYFLARRGGRVAVLSLVLAGIAMAAFTGSVTEFLLTIARPAVAKAILFWMAGGLGAASWRHSLVALPYMSVGALVILLHARDLNLLALGEEAATSLGVRVEQTKVWLLGAATLLTAAAVSVTGVIGFVGLLVPHAIRLLFGPDHRLLLPASALGGGLFLVLCDTLARSAWPPHDVRVAIITGLCGGPFFLFQLRRQLLWGV